MMRPLTFAALVALVACVGVTDPRDFHCLYVGDTSGVIAFHDTNNIITSCIWIIEKTDRCDPAIDSRRLFHASDCIVGTLDLASMRVGA